MSASQQALIARFAENLLRARERVGLSQEELGRRAELHRTEISLLERGTRIPRLDTILKLAGGLSITPNDLLWGMMIWRPGEVEPGGFRPADRDC